jgi:hypothetical protein
MAVGHQLNFYATPVDIAELEAAIRALEPVVVLHDRSSSAAPQVLPSLRVTQDGEPWLFYYLVREPDLSAVVTRHVPAQGYWTIDSLRSPVLEFHSCYFDRELLRRGRIHYADGFYGVDDVWRDKPEGFRTWAKAVWKAVRKPLRRHGTDYIGRDAATWLQGGGKLVT